MLVNRIERAGEPGHAQHPAGAHLCTDRRQPPHLLAGGVTLHSSTIPDPFPPLS
jgi:hypothetical protein